MTTRASTPTPCIDCGDPATVEAFQVDDHNQLLSDIAACTEHADPYLAAATDIVRLDSPTTLPRPAGPVPELAAELAAEAADVAESGL